MMNITKAVIALSLVLPLTMRAQSPEAPHPDSVAPITISPGVILKELTGRTAPGAGHSDRCSVAFFHLEPGCASAWSYNKTGEEAFFILKGAGAIWTDEQSRAVRPGSYLLVQPKTVRSVRASQTEALEFYAMTTPAWSKEDDVLTMAPAGAPK